MANALLQYGIHAVDGLLNNNPQRILKMLVLKGAQNKRVEQLMRRAQQQGIHIESVDKKRLDQLAQGVHQGVAVEVKAPEVYNEQYLEKLLSELQQPAFLLVLDGITDPHNLGACLRTAEAAGVHAVIAPRDKSAPLNGTAVKVASGAAERVPYVQVTNLARMLKQLQHYGVWITGTAGETELSVYDADFKGAMALVMGAEGAGMRRLTRDHCDQIVKIPMCGEVSSLNVSVATGVCLFEALRQRR